MDSNSSPIFVPIPEPVRTCGRPVRLDFRRWPSRIYSPSVATYPAASLVEEGVEALPRELTINGATKSPTCAYSGGMATASGWAGEYGPALGLSAGGTIVPVTGLHTPVGGQSARIADIDGGRCYASAGGAIPNYGAAEDFVIEALVNIESGRAGLGIVVAIRYGLYGFELTLDNSTPGLFLGDGARAFYELANDIGFGWRLIHLFVDRSAAMTAIYINGSHSKTLDFNSASLVGPIGDSSKYGVGGWPETVSAHCGCNISWLADWRGDAWLDTHLQPSVAASRYAALIGRGDRYSRRIYSFATGSKLGTVAPYFSCEDLTAGSGCTVAVPGTGGSWHWGSDMPRLIDGGLAIMPAEDHLLINSGLPGDYCQTLDGLVVTELAAVGPSGCTDAGSIIEDETYGYHAFTSRTVTVTESATYSSSIWFKPYTAGDPRRVRVVSGQSIVDVDLATGAITQSVKGPNSATLTDSGWVHVSLSVYTVSTSLNIQVFLIK